MAKDEINAFLGASTIFDGVLNFTGTVRIDGTFSGEINSEGTLIIGNTANITGKLHISNLVLSGAFKGEAVVRERVLLQKTAVFEGTMHTPMLSMEDGAIYEGDLHMKHTS